MTDKNKESEQLPQTLIDLLKADDQPVPFITSRVDREIMQQARSQFADRRPKRRRQQAWAALAATVLLALLVTQFRVPQVTEPGAIYADIDNSGRIDIADVLALARTRGSAQRSQAEIDAFAMRIVSLTSRGDNL